MPLPKQLFKDLQNTILASFTRDELRVALSLDMGESLDNLVADKAFSFQVHDLVAWAGRMGKTLTLLDCLCAQRPEVRALADLRPTIAAALAAPFALDPLPTRGLSQNETAAARAAGEVPDPQAQDEVADSWRLVPDTQGAIEIDGDRPAAHAHEQSLAFLARLETMLQQRGFTPAEKDLLRRTYAAAIHDLDMLHQNAQPIDGESTMPVDSSAPVRLTPRLLRKTAKTLATHTAVVASRQAEWPEVLVGDEVVVQSVAHLRTLQQEVRHTAGLVERYLLPVHHRRHRRERDGLLNSADSLVGLFQELPLRMDPEYQRRQTLAELAREVDDLLYYTGRYIIWLEIVANYQAQS